MGYRNIKYESGERIGSIILDRAGKRNALDGATVTELKDAFTRAAGDNAVKVVVLKAEGKVFSAGADLRYLQQLQGNSYEENLADSRALMDLFEQIYKHPKLVIAQVQGHAIAGGCGLATVCDLCYAVPEAKFGYTEVRIGFIPALVSVFLVSKIGEGRARELLLTGRLIEAREAESMGLINGVIDAGQMESRVYEKALLYAESTSAQSVALTKYLLSAARGLDTDHSLALAAEMNAKARGTADCQKGINNFLEKKKIIW